MKAAVTAAASMSQRNGCGTIRLRGAEPIIVQAYARAPACLKPRRQIYRDWGMARFRHPATLLAEEETRDKEMISPAARTWRRLSATILVMALAGAYGSVSAATLTDSTRLAERHFTQQAIPTALPAANAFAGSGADERTGSRIPAPLPTAVWLFGSAIIALLIVGRQRKQY